MTTDTIDIIEAPAAAVAKTRAIADGITHVQAEVAKFDFIAAGLAAIEAAHPKNVIVAAINTPAGMRQAEASWRAWRNPRLQVEQARKAAKAPVLALGRAIDAFAGQLEDTLLEGEQHYKAQITAEQERVEKERAAAAAKEQARVDAHRANVAVIRTYLTTCQAPGMTAERIQRGIDMLAGLVIGADYEEFQTEAANAQYECLDAMRTLHAQAASREAEVARLELQRKENERAAAELAEARAQLEAQAAAVRAEMAALDKARREAEAKADADRLRFAEAERAAADAANEKALHAEAAALIERAQQVATVAPSLSETDSEPAAPAPAAELPLVTHEAFVAFVMQAFDGKTTTPKVSPAWWAAVRAMGERLQAVTA